MSNMQELPEIKRPIESSCLFTNKETDPFVNLSINDTSFLSNTSARGVCPECKKSRRYYCYTCYKAIEGISECIPKIKLPIKVDIIKHPKEVDGKSTSAHAAVLAPEDVRIFTYPNFPTYENEKVLLIFPGKGAVDLKTIFSSIISSNSAFQNSDSDEILNFHDCICHQYSSNTAIRNLLPFERIIFIDSTWRQTRKLYNDPHIKKLPCALLTSHKSVFWRHQRGKPDNYLSTIEAVYYFFVELHELIYPDVPYCGHFDNLLFYFKFMYNMIRTLYDPLTLKAYQ